MRPTAQRPTEPVQVLGVDISASASAAHRKTWLTRATVADGTIRFDAPVPAADLPHEPRGRDAVFDALRETATRLDTPAVIGLDAPFSLPEPIVEATSWEAFLASFPDAFADPDAFQTACHRRTAQATDGAKKEIRRRCDARFDGLCPYNRFIFRITYHTLASILRPVVGAGGAGGNGGNGGTADANANANACDANAAAWPFQPSAATAGRVFLETYPAAVLQSRLDVRSTTYKDTNDDPAFRRAVTERILASDRVKKAATPHTAVLDATVNDTAGDAVDSLLAAWATALWALGDRPTADAVFPAVEGYIHY